MPIDTRALDAVALAYVRGMTPIRGRRVHRLVKRAFATFDHVLPATAADGAAALVALRTGTFAVCRTDGHGPSAEVVTCALAGAAVASAHDLLKDSLPVVRWTLAHPALDAGLGPLAIAAGDVEAAERDAVAALLARREPPSA